VRHIQHGLLLRLLPSVGSLARCRLYLEPSFMIDRVEAEEILQEWINRFVSTSTPSRHANASGTYQGATQATEQ
jgi:hypothetical protein